jgi:hypothetical protein
MIGEEGDPGAMVSGESAILTPTSITVVYGRRAEAVCL